ATTKVSSSQLTSRMTPRSVNEIAGISGSGTADNHSQISAVGKGGCITSPRRASHMSDFIGDVVEGRMPVRLGVGGLEQRPFVGWTRRRDVVGFDHPDADAFGAAAVDVAAVADRRRGVGRVEAADMAMVEAMLAADEHFPERPCLGHACLLRDARHLIRFASQGLANYRQFLSEIWEFRASGRGRRPKTALW